MCVKTYTLAFASLVVWMFLVIWVSLCSGILPVVWIPVCILGFLITRVWPWSMMIFVIRVRWKVRLSVGIRVTLFRWLIVTFGAFQGFDPRLVWLFKVVVLLVVMATVQAVVMVLFDVANMLFVLVVRMIAVPSVSVPLIFAGQLFMLSLYVIRPPPCADRRVIHIIAVVTLVSCRSRLRVTIVALRIRQLVR